MKIGRDSALKGLSFLVMLACMMSIPGLKTVFASEGGSPSESELASDLPPTLVEPAGTYWTNDLQYKWTVNYAATEYQYRVWDGATKMWDRTVTSAACGSTYCTDFPTELELIDGAYKWQARAYIRGVWSDWSGMKWYSIKAGFNSQFTTDAAGWQPTYGGWTWDLYNGNYRTEGLLGKFSTSRFDQVYGVYTYEVRMRRQGTDMYSVYGLLVNGSPWPLDVNKQWYKGYGFYITRDGYFTVYIYDNGKTIQFQDFTPSTAINNGWYNTLKMTYHKNTGFFQFFINGTRVFYGHLNSFKWGNVGVTMLKSQPGWEQLLVDWAKLEITAPSSDAESGATGGICIDEASLVPAGCDDTGH